MKLERLATRVSCEGMARLKMECEKRYAVEAGYTPYGRVITELVMMHLLALTSENMSSAAPIPRTSGKRKPANHDGNAKRSIGLAKSA
jgi:hypothetical protein